jgi:hypothetical protein
VTCEELGHYANKCPMNQAGNEDERHVHVTWDASTFVTYHVHATGMVGKFKRSEMLLDNQVDISVIHPSLLREIEQSESPVNINGVGGVQFAIDKEGYLDDFFHVYTSEDTHANVLSFLEVEDKYCITYVLWEAIIIHLPDRGIRFECRGKMYIADWSKSMSDESLMLDEKQQVLCSDMMQVDSNKFLITVCKLLQLVMQCRIKRESQSKLDFALQGQLNLLCSRSFVPTVVHMDPQSAFHALTGSFPEVVIDVGGAGDYVAKVDVKICRIKEIYRIVRARLKMKLLPTMVKDLVAYAVSRINIRRTMAINLNVCP